jgi:hypothetical protein
VAKGRETEEEKYKIIPKGHKIYLVWPKDLLLQAKTTTTTIIIKSNKM